jgi:hypothetical protein
MQLEPIITDLKGKCSSMARIATELDKSESGNTARRKMGSLVSGERATATSDGQNIGLAARGSAVALQEPKREL